MNTVETIQTKVVQLPPKAQEEVLEAVEQIEGRYGARVPSPGTNGNSPDEHVLSQIAKLAIDCGVTDLAARHDFYAHGKLED